MPLGTGAVEFFALSFADPVDVGYAVLAAGLAAAVMIAFERHRR